MVRGGMGGDMLGGDTSSSSGAKPPRLPKAGMVGPAEHLRVTEDACLDAATMEACVDDAPWRCLLVSIPLPSCTPHGDTRGHN